MTEQQTEEEMLKSWRDTIIRLLQKHDTKWYITDGPVDDDWGSEDAR